MDQSRWRSLLLGACGFAALSAGVAVVTPAAAQDAAAPALPAEAMIDPGTSVAMILQDSSDCQNSTVSDKDPSTVRGTVNIIKQDDGNARVSVSFIGQPGLVYHFYLKCVRALGDIKTYDEGEGNGVFVVPANSLGKVVAFDMYPDGAPSGNKFQSTTMRLP